MIILLSDISGAKKAGLPFACDICSLLSSNICATPKSQILSNKLTQYEKLPLAYH